jgi:Holliday junction resolvase RusA-like endonuclease
MTTVLFTVYGRPAPAGSKRAFIPKGGARPIVIDANANAKPWKQEVAKAALQVTGGVLLSGPCGLEATFFLARPKGHFGTGRNSEVVKASSPAFPGVAPDCTKLLRGLEDAMTGTVWRDDAQVVYQAASKRYGTPERCEVMVWTLPATQSEALEIMANPGLEGEAAA